LLPVLRRIRPRNTAENDRSGNSEKKRPK